jgi:hypothetical protein
MRSRQRGIFIILSLFLVVVVMMVLAAAVKLIPTTLSSASSFNDDQRAIAAAQAGVRYAVARLQSDFLWAANGNTRTVDQPGMVVIEDRGNVFGYMKNAEGDVTQFRLRFNFQDGNLGQDNRLDPNVFVEHPYVSVNNLTNYVSTAPVPSTGGAPDFAVPVGYSVTYEVPSRKVFLVVEGMAGQGLRDTTPAALNPAAGTNRRVSRAYVEAIYAQSVNSGGDSVLSGGGDINIFHSGAGSSLKLEMAGGGSGDVTVRASGSLNVNGGASPNVIGSKATGLLTFADISSFDEDPASVSTQVQVNPSLMSLDWSSLNLPDSSPTSTKAAQIKAGIYYWNETAGQMEWFDDIYTPLWVPPGAGLPVSTDFQEVRSDTAGGITWENAKGTGKSKGKNAGPLISISGDVNVQSTLLTDDVFFVTENPDIVTYEMKFNGPKSDVNTFYSSGDFYVQGPVQGQGTSVIAGGALTINNGGVDITVNPNADSGVNLYAKGDLSLSTNVNGKAKGGTEYADLKMSGVAFTWGNFEAILDNPAGGASKAGKFEITGALTAYGGDPAVDNPGANGAGNVSIWAKDPKLKYDPSFTSGITGATSGELSKVMWTTY